MAKLKVFRTAIGFHDAYVAAASQKSALSAWGTQANLFARGAAELVTDPELTAEPLAKPGTVIKRLRGTEAEQIAALPPTPARAKPAGKPAPPPARKPPRPSRAALDSAERAIEVAAAKHAEEDEAIAREQAELDARRDAIKTVHEKERAALEKRRREAEKSYGDAVQRWNG